MNYLKLALLIVFFLMLQTCSEKDDAPKVGGVKVPDNLVGTLIYEWAGVAIYGFDVRQAEKYIYFEHSNDLNGWDVSREGRLLLTSRFIPGRFDVTQYTLVDREDGSIIEQFEYYPLNGGRDNVGILSPDNELIAIKPNRYQGIVIVSKEGEVLFNMEAVNGEKIEQGTEVVWLPGNALMFTHGNYILRSDFPYDQITLVKEMNFEHWGNINSSFDGTLLSLKVGNHIHLMNVDGTNLVQVTESNQMEREAVFSPNGEYLLVGSNYIPGMYSKGQWTLKIIPADGKKYNVDATAPNSPEVISVIAKDEKLIENCSEIMLWR